MSSNRPCATRSARWSPRRARRSMASRIICRWTKSTRSTIAPCMVPQRLQTSSRELCRLLCEETGHADIQPAFAPVRTVNPVTRRLAAVEGARDAFGFQAQIGLRQGLHELIEWHAAVMANEAMRVA